jgi:hypothetical protein
MLQSLAAFLAPAWSSCNDVNVVVKPNSSFASSGFNITVPERIIFKGLSGFDNYRLWRFGLWHEAQHVKVNSNLLSASKDSQHPQEQVTDVDSGLSFLDISVRNILEDYYVNIRGLQVWKGMQAEQAFIQAVLGLRTFPTPPPKGSFRAGLYAEYTLQVFSQLLLHSKVNCDLTQWEDYENVKETVAYARNAVDALATKRLIERDARLSLNQLAHEVAVKLQLDKSSFISPSWHPCQFDFTILQFNIKREQLKNEVRSSIRSKAQRLEALKGNHNLKQEYEKLQEFGGRRETLVDATEKPESLALPCRIYVPRDINVASNEVRSLKAYANQDALVLRMKARLSKWKTRWSEVHGKYGDELDVEAVIDDAKYPFFDEERLQAPKRVTLLLDHSGSIRSFEKTYKAAIAALCEAFKLLTVNFLVLAFNQTYTARSSTVEGNETVDNVWLIKGAKESWGERSLARLVYVQASSSTTPLGEILTVSWPLVRNFKPEVHITLTDGLVSDTTLTKEQVRKYRRSGIRMLGIGIHNDAVNVARNLRILSFDNILAVSNIQQIPNKIVNLLIKAD